MGEMGGTVCKSQSVLINRFTLLPVTTGKERETQRERETNTPVYSVI